jgi:hypothetical protein
MGWFDHWLEDDPNEDIGPLSHWNEDFSYGEPKQVKKGKKDRQVICDNCGLYYKTGCTYYTNDTVKKCIKQK